MGKRLHVQHRLCQPQSDSSLPTSQQWKVGDSTCCLHALGMFFEGRRTVISFVFDSISPSRECVMFLTALWTLNRRLSPRIARHVSTSSHGGHRLCPYTATGLLAEAQVNVLWQRELDFVFWWIKSRGSFQISGVPVRCSFLFNLGLVTSIPHAPLTMPCPVLVKWGEATASVFKLFVSSGCMRHSDVFYSLPKSKFWGFTFLGGSISSRLRPVHKENTVWGWVWGGLAFGQLGRSRWISPFYPLLRQDGLGIRSTAKLYFFERVTLVSNMRTSIFFSCILAGGCLDQASNSTCLACQDGVLLKALNVTVLHSAWQVYAQKKSKDLPVRSP